jgi:hypothetical protein
MIYLLLGGLFGGWDAYIPFINNGMFDLRDKLNAAGFAVTTYTWGDWQVAQNDISTFNANRLTDSSGAKIIVIGFSGGGSRASYITSPVDLMVLYDPSPAWQMKNPCGANIKKVLCYHNNHPLMLGLGGGVLIGPQVSITQVSEQHLTIQYDQTLHAKTIAACQAL